MTKLQDYPNIPASSLTGDDKILVVRKNDQGLVKLSSLPANIPDNLKTEMNNVLNKKFKTSTTYPPAIWDDKVNLMAVCPEETASGNVVTFVNGADDVPLKKCEATLSLSLEGYSAVNVKRCGKNLIKAPTFDAISLCFDFGRDVTVDNIAFSFVANETISSTNTAALIDYRKEDGTHGYKTLAAFYDDNNVRWVNNTPQNGRFSIVSQNVTFRYIYIYYTTSRLGYSAFNADNITNWQVEIGNVVSEYEQYITPITYTAPLGRTIHGGIAGVIKGQGEITHGTYILPSTGWAYYPTTGKNTFNLIIPNCKNAPALCGLLYPYENHQFISQQSNKTFMFFVSGNNIRISICDNDYSSASDFGAHISGTLLVHELPTPEPFTFTPVPINSKLGFNTMLADTGNLEVIYRSQGTAIPVPIPVPTTLIEKTVTQNGTYSAEDDNADGYSEVVVDVAAQNPGKPVTLMAETSNASYTYTVPEDGRYLFVSESSGSDHTVSLPSGKSWILSSTNTNRGFFVGVADLLSGDQVAMNDSGTNYKCKWVYKVDPSISFESVDFEETLQNPGEVKKLSRGVNYDVMAIICYGCTNVNVYDYSYVDGNTCSVGYFNYGKIYIKVGKESTFARIYWNPLSSNAFYRRVDFKITISAGSYPIAEEASF